MRVRLFPILLVQLYLNLTVLLFAFGPWAWPVPDAAKLYGFLLLAHFGLLVGYLSAVRRQPAGYRGPFKLDTIIKIVLVVSVAWALPGFYVNTQGAAGLSIASIYESVITATSSLSNAYSAKHEVVRLAESAPSTLVRISLIFLPITALLLPLGIVFWSRLSWKGRTGFLAAQTVVLCGWVAIGTTKGIADIFMVVPWLILIAKPQVLRKLSLARVGKITAIGLACIMIVFLFFAAAKRPASRARVRVPQIASLRLSADANHPLLLVLPERRRYVPAQLCSYLTQGYYGLSLALERPFVWCYGFGHGYFSAQAASRRFFPGNHQDYLLERTYPGRIESADKSWGAMGKWHSIYPWIASDLSFAGAIVFAFVIGHLFAMSWIDALRHENPFAVGVFALLVIMLFYFPLNNQVLAFYRTAIPFWVLLPLWLLTRRKLGAGRAVLALSLGRSPRRIG